MIDIHYGIKYTQVALDPVSRFSGGTERTAACYEVSRNSNPLLVISFSFPISCSSVGLPQYYSGAAAFGGRMLVTTVRGNTAKNYRKCTYTSTSKPWIRFAENVVMCTVHVGVDICTTSLCSPTECSKRSTCNKSC